MNSLSRIIGPAPSELSLGAFLMGRLKKERDRVNASLEAFRHGAIPSWGKKAVAAEKPPKAPPKPKTKRALTSATRLAKILHSSNITESELQTSIEEILREARANKQ